MPLLLTITSVENEANITTHYVGCFTDISQRVKNENELHDLAFYDPLTGLANRRLMIDRLNVAFIKSARSLKYGAVLFIDLDQFKALNDQHGHSQGDVMLEKVADRLTVSMREGDTVSRFGGDEFVVLLDDVGDTNEKAQALALEIAEKLRIALNHPYTLHAPSMFEWSISPSIGVTLFINHEKSVETVLKEADQAMFVAKKAGRNRVEIFEK
ncbi:MAG: diguanylate cyclase [Methylomarinum sp.]|nr:diguanylate cyclase [Methylomarinum sp.]